MNNLQDTLLFPFRDKDAWSQFLIACVLMLAAFIIPLLPVIFLMGYTVKIMRQIIEEGRSPSMPSWQGADWSEMFMDGLRLYGAQLALMLPLILFLGCGLVTLFSGSISFAALADEGNQALAPIGGLLFFVGMGSIMIFALLSIPYGIVTAAAQAHVARKRSFTAAFEFQEWWPVFRSGLGQFVIVYVMILIASFVFSFILQIAMVTIVLICVVPLLMIPYSAYLMIITNTLYAQAYVAGREALQKTEYATS
jgi:uncharacterized membrane protein YgdD (TMEM256/DUF423 family)